MRRDGGSDVLQAPVMLHSSFSFLLSFVMRALAMTQSLRTDSYNVFNIRFLLLLYINVYVICPVA